MQRGWIPERSQKMGAVIAGVAMTSAHQTGKEEWHHYCDAAIWARLWRLFFIQLSMIGSVSPVRSLISLPYFHQHNSHPVIYIHAKEWQEYVVKFFIQWLPNNLVYEWMPSDMSLDCQSDKMKDDIHAYLYRHTHAYTDTRMLIQTHACLYRRMHTYTDTCILIQTHACLYRRMHT